MTETEKLKIVAEACGIRVSAYHGDVWKSGPTFGEAAVAAILASVENEKRDADTDES